MLRARMEWASSRASFVRIHFMHSPVIRTAVTLYRPSHFKRSTVGLLFVVLIIAAAVPVLTHALPPLSDYPRLWAYARAVLYRDLCEDR